jgi:hypothetical protein
VKLRTLRNVAVSSTPIEVELAGATAVLIYREGTGILTIKSNDHDFDFDISPGEPIEFSEPVTKLQISSTVAENITLAVSDSKALRIQGQNEMTVGGVLPMGSDVDTLAELGKPVIMGMAYEESGGVFHNPPLRSLDGESLLVNTPREVPSVSTLDIEGTAQTEINAEGFKSLRIQFTNENIGDANVQVLDQWGKPLTVYSMDGDIQVQGVITIAEIAACKTYLVPLNGITVVAFTSSGTTTPWSFRWAYSHREVPLLKA